MSGCFTGYAAVFDRLDRGGDIVRRGAFAASLADWAARGAMPPLLWQHDPARPVGRVLTLGEDAHGLAITARIDAAGAARLVASGQLTGLSFGYRVLAARGQHPRQLLTLDLAEISLVIRPMQPAARLTLPAPTPRTRAQAGA